MVKSEIMADLEKLYEAQEKYYQLKLDFEKKVRRESPEYIPLSDVLGDFNDGMESVDLSMKEFEYRMAQVGVKWDEEPTLEEDVFEK